MSVPKIGMEILVMVVNTRTARFTMRYPVLHKFIHEVEIAVYITECKQKGG